MPQPASIFTSGTSFNVSGTPVTNQLGVGGITGNAITISGLTISPSAPGWRLVASEGGPGFVSGNWQSGAIPRAAPPDVPQGAFYRSGDSGIGAGGGGDARELVTNDPWQTATGFHLTKTGWILVGLLVTLFLTDKGR